jgi:hypothetical protein
MCTSVAPLVARQFIFGKRSHPVSALFFWWQEIEGVNGVRGHITGLTVFLSIPVLSDAALCDLIGLLYRYDVSMSVLRSQLTPKNEHWFRDPEKYWYEKIFAKA